MLLGIRLLYIFTIPHKVDFKDFTNSRNNSLLVRTIFFAYTILCQRLFFTNLVFIGVLLGRKLEGNTCSESFGKTGEVVNKGFAS